MHKASIGPVDIHVGQRLREARNARGFSQQRLGEELGLTFQQVQKYEKGKNRIGTGRLHKIAQILAVPVSYFFEGTDGYDSRVSSSEMELIYNALKTREGIRIAAALSRIESEEVRRRLADLLEAVISDPVLGARNVHLEEAMRESAPRPRRSGGP